MPTLHTPTYRTALSSLENFSRFAVGRPLRPYQLEPGNAIVEAVLSGKAGIFSVLMSRQAGKNELSAQLEAYLLCLFADLGGLLVKAAPTFNPQVEYSIKRLRGILNQPYFDGLWGTRGRTTVMGKAGITFFSAEPGAGIMGATASILLEVDEAQGVDQEVYHVGLRPMASATNAVTVLYGTAWDENNILEQQRRVNRNSEARTGRRLNFESAWPVVAATNSKYREYVADEIAKHGAGHFWIKTQFDLEPMADLSRMFPPRLLERMRGSHPRETAPAYDTTYVAGIDVAGSAMDPGLELAKPILSRGDENVIVIAAVDFDTDDEGVTVRTVRVVDIVRWKGVGFEQSRRRALHLLRDKWNAGRVAIDATGVGDGLASYLDGAMRRCVQCVRFSAPTKSDLGYQLLSAAETGTVRIYGDDDEDSRELWRQLANMEYELARSELLQFGVPPAVGHDDCVTALMLAVEAAKLASPPPFGILIRGQDPDRHNQIYPGW